MHLVTASITKSWPLFGKQKRCLTEKKNPAEHCILYVFFSFNLEGLLKIKKAQVKNKGGVRILKYKFIAKAPGSGFLKSGPWLPLPSSYSETSFSECRIIYSKNRCRS